MLKDLRSKEGKVQTFGSQAPFGRPGQSVEVGSAYLMLAADNTTSATPSTLITIVSALTVL